MDRRLRGTAPRTGRFQMAVVEWLDNRFSFVEAVDAELYRRVPNYATAVYRYLGGLAAIIVVIEFGCGFLLGISYIPVGNRHPARAFTRVDFVQHAVYLGRLMGGTHFCGASLLI